jgi:hypothetical protein
MANRLATSVAIGLLIAVVGGCAYRRVSDDDASGGDGGGGSGVASGGTAGTGTGKGGSSGSSGGPGATGGSMSGGTGGAGGMGGAAPSKAIGTSCTASSECGGGASCVEGVCCGGPCNGVCMSCLMANTGVASGTCAAVRDGVAHNSDCTASPATTCGLDGVCDGGGACRRHRAGTLCGSNACPQGSSTFTLAPTCNGNGTCVPSAPISCVSYACDGAACRTTCTAHSNCSTSAYCAGTACVPKLSAGALCAADVECTSGACGGRCCNSGMPCTCPAPREGNLLMNPTFDQNLAGWTVTLGDGTGAWTSVDVSSCPFSGSVYMTATGSVSPVISQCVQVSPSQGIWITPFEFRGRVRGPGECRVEHYFAPNCTGTFQYRDERIVWINVGWSGNSLVPVDVTAEEVSIRIVCDVYDEVTQQDDFYFDDLYFAPAP